MSSDTSGGYCWARLGLGLHREVGDGQVLVVANQTLGGQQLIEEIRRLIASEPSSFYVVVPAAPAPRDFEPPPGGIRESEEIAGMRTDWGESARRETERHAIAQAATNDRLARLTSTIRAAGATVVGEVGDSDPLQAIQVAMAEGPFDGIVISTLPAGVSRWLRMDVPSRVERRFRLPVTTITASGQPAP